MTWTLGMLSQMLDKNSLSASRIVEKYWTLIKKSIEREFLITFTISTFQCDYLDDRISS